MYKDIITMKFFYIIPPINHNDLAKETGTNAVYCLAHLCLEAVNPNWREYRDFFIQAKKDDYWVTLDNGAAEHSLVTEDVLIELTKEIMPSEVIAPDILYDKNLTSKCTISFISRLSDENLLGKVEVFAVPQGSNASEYIASYLEMLNNPDIQTIGLSKLSVPKSFCSITDSHSISVNRRYLVKLLNELQLLQKPIHLLGMRNITEYKAYTNIKNIRSTDSCYTILSAINGIKLDADVVLDVVNETPHDYFFQTLTSKQLELARHNLHQLSKIIEQTNDNT